MSGLTYLDADRDLELQATPLLTSLCAYLTASISTHTSNWPLQYHVSKSEFMIFPLKPISPQIFPLLANGSSILSVSQAKALVLSWTSLFLLNIMFAPPGNFGSTFKM